MIMVLHETSTFQARGFAHISNGSSGCSIAAGGSGKKVIEWVSVEIPRANAVGEPLQRFIVCLAGFRGSC